MLKREVCGGDFEATIDHAVGHELRRGWGFCQNVRLVVAGEPSSNKPRRSETTRHPRGMADFPSSLK